VQPKDVITNVNDQPAPAVPLRSLRAMLRDTTRTVEITIRRAETTTSVELKPREFRMKPGSTVETSQSDRDR
jgi:C-terminal processing protease CtpA/Prc